MAELVVDKSAVRRRPPVEVGVDRVWRFFCSVRAAVYEVAILALLVLIGTLAGSEVPHWIQEALPFSKPLIDHWYAWNVFRSLPFAFMLGLLAVAIMICTLNRAPAMWQSIAWPTVITTYGFLRSAEVRMSASAESDAAGFTDDIVQQFKAARYRVLTEAHGGETHLFADRNRYGKLGTFPFHLALILILIGGIIGSRYGFREKSFIIPEGQSLDVGHSTGLSVQLVDFQDTYTELGQAHEYRSDLVITRDGKEVRSGSITVNHPISYRSTVFYQSSFGPAVELSIADASGQVVYQGAVPLGVDLFAKGNPDAPAGVLDLLPLNARLYIIGPDANPTNAPDQDALGLHSGQMYVELHDLSSGQPLAMPLSINQGEPARLGDLTVTFQRESQWTGLQVANNPGIPIFWAAALLLIGGLAVVFYFPHRRIRGIVAPGPDGTATAVIAPMARRDWSARRTFEQFGAGLMERQPGIWTVIAAPTALQLNEPASAEGDI